MSRKKKKPFNRLPNGFGSIKKLSGNRRKPYAVYAPSFKINGVTVPGHIVDYAETWEAGYERLVLYRANREWEENKEKNRLYTFSEVYKMYFHEKYEASLKKLSKQSRDSTSAAFKNCSDLHNKIFYELTYNDLQNNIDSYVGKLKHSSLELIKSLYNGMYKYAIKSGIVSTDYAQYVEIRAEDDDESGVPFTEDELKKLWASNLMAAKIAVILCYSGWRISEFINIEIDLKEMVFRGGMKTRAGKGRIVPIHNSILPILIEYMDNPIKSSNGYRNAMYEALEELGIEKHTPQDCRHTFSWLCDKYKVDRLSKKMMLGHSIQNDVTDKVYGHRTTEELREEISKLKRY